MLFVRTGANGTCKSLFTLQDARDKQLKELRPVCVIVGDASDPTRQYVKIKPSIMQEFAWTTCRFEEWWDQPDGTIFLADECHNYLPKRPNGSPVPLHVSRLAEHRARGFDFFLLTQHPSNMDQFVTKLVGAPGWHQHLKRVFGGSNVTNVLQWDAVNNVCEKNGSAKSAQVTLRKQPKEVYAWYDSAELHTANKTRLPKQVYQILIGFPVVIALLAFVAHFFWQRVSPKTVDQVKAESAAAGAPAAGRPEAKVLTTAEYISSYQPRLTGLMHTAPAYDELTKPKRVPVPAACVEMQSVGCKCYTQDATPYPVDLSMCRQLVAHGAFLAFQPEGEQRRAVEQPQRGRQGTETAMAEPAAAILIEGGSKSAGASTAVSAAAPDLGSKPRVPPGSKWSFQTGG